MVQVPADLEEIEQQGGLEAVLDAAVSNPDAPRLEVVYDDVKPELLRNAAPAIVRGRLGEDGRVHADEVLLKCPARYREDVPEQSSDS